jgi:predicted aspartyl protease
MTYARPMFTCPRARLLMLLVPLLALPACSMHAGLGIGSPSSAARLPEAIVELHHPSRQVSTGLQISPLSEYPTLMIRGGDTAGRFLLDTGGAGAMIVTDAFLQRAGGGRVPTSANINGSHYPMGVIPQLEIGDGLVIRNAACIVNDLAQMQQVCGGVAIDGVLTMGPLQGLELDIDVPNRVAHFRPAHLPQRPATTTELKRPSSHAGETRPYATLRVGDADIPALLDTGNYTAIDIPAHLFSAARTALGHGRASYGAAGFNSKASVTERGLVQRITLGPIILTNTQVHVIPHADVTEAVLGIAVLKHYRLIYNTHTRTTLLVGPNELSDAAPSAEVVQLVEEICRDRVH